VSRVDKAADVFFRVRNVYKKSVIEVADGEKVLASFKREHMAPGEMEHILLPRVLLDKAAGACITVSVKEA
jgi:plastocyanin domain-containing protein